MRTIPAIEFTPHPEATPETELSSLAAIYRLVLNSRAQKETVEPRQADGLEDAKKGSELDRAR